MLKTLNTDEFDDSPVQEMTHNYEPHNILYGDKGWTDALDDDTLGLLAQAGAVEWIQTVKGAGFETRIYVSTKGVGPR